MCAPILSHNSATNNVLLQITVPKRTGRKRKRGSQDPFTDNSSTDPMAALDDDGWATESLQSHSRMDSPAQILRKLKDNPENYTIEAVAEIRNTHRFRGMLMSGGSNHILKSF